LGERISAASRRGDARQFFVELLAGDGQVLEARGASASSLRSSGMRLAALVGRSRPTAAVLVQAVIVVRSRPASLRRIQRGKARRV